MHIRCREQRECTSDAGKHEGTKSMQIRCRETGGYEVNADQMQGNWRERRKCTSGAGEPEETK